MAAVGKHIKRTRSRSRVISEEQESRWAMMITPTGVVALEVERNGHIIDSF